MALSEISEKLEYEDFKMNKFAVWIKTTIMKVSVTKHICFFYIFFMSEFTLVSL